jgi:uncharacterized membrane protein YphA (DoxX/SURF4 family)
VLREQQSHGVWMSKLPAILRTVLGLAFVVFGLNFFLHFIKQPAPSKAALEFMIPFIGGNYMNVVKVIEIAVAFAYRDAFAPMLQRKTSPHADRGTVAA